MPKAPPRRRSRSADHHAARVAVLRDRLGPDGTGKFAGKADALLIANPNDIRYLTGFVGEDSWALIRLGGTDAAARPYILSDERFREQISREAPGAYTRIRKRGLAEELAKLADRLQLQKVGLPSSTMTVAMRKAVVKALGGASRAVDVQDGLLQQRAVKEPREVKAIEAAAKIQQQAFRDTLVWMDENGTTGLREYEIAAFLEYRMRALGADGRSFPSIVAVNANAALPHAIPGRDKTKKGCLLLIDWGARSRGYCADTTRTVGLGGMSRKMREVYQIVLDAQMAGIDAIAPGVKLKDVDSVSRGIIKKAGYAKQFGHGLGHGLGLDIHEQPSLSQRAGDGVLEPGMVVTVEPGIYLPGIGGVRIEDDILVTAKGHRVLTDLPKQLHEAII